MVLPALGLAALAVTLLPLLLGTPVVAQEPDDDSLTTEELEGEEPAPSSDAPAEGDDVVEDASERIGGTLRADGEPVEGVTVRVTDAAGTEIGVAETDEDGGWEVPLPDAGEYTVTLDESTLPDDIGLEEGRSAEIEQRVGPGRTAQVAFRLTGEGADDGFERTLAGTLSQATVNGIKFGLIIAMASVGLSLVFGTTGLVNFSHAELVTFGAIAAWFLNAAGFHVGPLDLFGPLHLIPAAALAVVLGAALGGTIDRGLFRPLRLRGTGAFQLLVISIGLSLALRQLLLIWFGSESLRYRNYTIQAAIDIGPISITPRDLIIMGLSLAVLFLVGAMLLFTRIGKAMRAVADNRDLAESSGIDVQRIILLVWVLGAGLAALGGIFQGSITSVNYLNGFQLLLLMFAAVILGGLGTAFGAVAGGIVIGLATEISTVWVSPELKFVFALAILVAVLLVRPQGIFGVRERVA